MQRKLNSYFSHTPPFLSAIQPDAIYSLSVCLMHVKQIATSWFLKNFHFQAALLTYHATYTQHMGMNRKLYTSTTCCNAWVDNNPQSTTHF